MNNVLPGSGGEAIVKLKTAEALVGKKIILLPVSEGGMNLKTTDINRLIETLGVISHQPEERLCKAKTIGRSCVVSGLLK